MGVLDKLTGKHHTSGNGYAAHDPSATTTSHHGGTTNVTGDTYGHSGTKPGSGGGGPPLPARDPYPTHTSGTGLTGHNDPYNQSDSTVATTGHGDHSQDHAYEKDHEKRGLFGQKKHDDRHHHDDHHGSSATTEPGYARGVPTGGIGSTTTTSHGGAAYGNDSTHGTHGTTGQYGNPGHSHHGTTTDYDNDRHDRYDRDNNNKSSGGILGFGKKDDLQDSVEKERKAKKELDEAMARHEAARGHTESQLQAQEEAARREFEAAERRLKEVQANRSTHGH